MSVKLHPLQHLAPDTTNGLLVQLDASEERRQPIYSSQHRFQLINSDPVISSSTSSPVSQLPYIPTDNTLNTAINIGTLDGVKTFTNFVGSSDTQDYYRLTLTAGGNFNLSLTGLSADADVQFLDSLGNVVASSTYGSNHDEAINLAGLAAGDYYVRVMRYNGDTNYTLNLSKSKPSDLVPAEKEMGTLDPGTYTRFGSLSQSNTTDVYHFSLGNDVGLSANVNLTLTGLTADADVRIIRDENENGIVDPGEVIVRSTLGGSNSESINLQGLSTFFNKSDYLVEVYQYSGNTNYQLNLTVASGFGVAPEPNNTLSQAYNMGTLLGGRYFSGHVNGDWASGSIDLKDFYRFHLDTTSNFRLALLGSIEDHELTEDADVYVIRDVNNNYAIDPGEIIASSTSAGTDSESLQLDGLGAGDYYVGVYPYSNHTTDYLLSLGALQGPGYGSFFNETMNEALEVHTLNGDRVYEGLLVGGTDDNYFHFNLGVASDVSLLLDGLTGNANLQLIHDTNNNGVINAGEVLGSSTFSGTTAEAINLHLIGGDYFVRVYHSEANSAHYTLNLDATP